MAKKDKYNNGHLDHTKCECLLRTDKLQKRQKNGELNIGK